MPGRGRGSWSRRERGSDTRVVWTSRRSWMILLPFDFLNSEEFRKTMGEEDRKTVECKVGSLTDHVLSWDIRRSS